MSDIKEIISKEINSEKIPLLILKMTERKILESHISKVLKSNKVNGEFIVGTKYIKRISLYNED